MLKKFFLTFLLLGLCGSLLQASSMNFEKYPSKKSELGQISDINILAVMVEFQVDDFELTYGDGTFGSIYSQDYGTDIIDPLPHDKNYFEDHLDFAVNYFAKVSNGLVSVNYTVLPDIYTVSEPMREYSPLQGESFKVLADFSGEVWDLVNAANPSLDFGQFNTFVVFHAGAGKDISTSDLFGEARDLPSIYLGPTTLKEFYGNSFQGFEVGQNQFINNTIILPETESREEAGIGGTTLIELSMNGLIVSSIASRMGLPDLFDAETGKSAIGRFGLMDGQSLFAYAGLFPPEPSAWEKIFLGWEKPVVVDNDTDQFLLSARLAAVESDAKIIKVPINSSEYYLIENRSRDVNNDGITLTYKVSGEIKTINFSEDMDNFNNAIVDTMRGVVLDVDEFDWALPGSGILIWHIDENIINEYIAVNRINVGERKGVDLEEADGIQDIGEEFQTIFGDIIIAEGDEFDFWYSSNNSELYTNEFGSNTKPDTKTNSGANSLVRISNFSDIAPKMSFDIRFGSERITLFGKGELDSSLPISDNKIQYGGNSLSSYFIAGQDLYVIKDSTIILEKFSEKDVAILHVDEKDLVFGAVENNLNLALFEDDNFSQRSIITDEIITAPLAVEFISSSEILIYSGLNDGSIQIFEYDQLNDQDPNLIQTVQTLNSPVSQIVYHSGNLFAAGGNNFYFAGKQIQFDENIKSFAVTKQSSGELISLILTEQNLIYSYKADSDEQKLVFKGVSDIESFALADLKNDGNNYLVFNSANQIYALNLNGNFADNFPVSIKNDEKLAGMPLISDINNDKMADIISVSLKGNIFAYSGESGKILNEFPLSTGGSFSGAFALAHREDQLFISAATADNEFFVWRINGSRNALWSNNLGNNFNNAFLDQAENDNFISEYFPVSRTYNWPNPVYGNETYIRTYVGEDSNVNVKVFDLAGDLVDEFEFFANGGLDTEYLWNVDDIQSGAYFARLEVKSNSGKSESKIIKIAIVK